MVINPRRLAMLRSGVTAVGALKGATASVQRSGINCVLPDGRVTTACGSPPFIRRRMTGRLCPVRG
jgi:hypothetical protein